ncbi:MAG: M28 family metallopeptidase, partial [Nitrososphaera sp.]|nr:M28 family metallopeptidase [Nitrososphaera sp.]
MIFTINNIIKQTPCSLENVRVPLRKGDNVLSRHNLTILFRALFLYLVIPQSLVSQSLPRDVEASFASAVSQSRLQETVHKLVEFGPRMGGTESGDKSAEYLTEQFRSAGLEVKVVQDPELLSYEHTNWSLAVEEPASMKGLIENEWLSGYSPSLAPQKARLVSDGDSEGAYSGSIVLTDKRVRPEFYDRLVKAGAVCILTYAPAEAGKYSDAAFISSLRASAENPIPVFHLSYSNGERLKQELGKEINIILSFSSETVIARKSPKTIVATLKGESDEYYIVCAHGDSDSGGPGADDNASGTAGVVEVARSLKQLIDDQQVVRPKKTIKFIVWGAEIYSTGHYVRRNADALDKILGVMNYDEIGTGATRNCLYFESNELPHNERLLRTLNAVGEEYVGKPGFWEESTTNPSQGGTDSYVFLPDYLRRLNMPDVKIPSVTIYTAAWDELAHLKQTEGWASKAWKGHPDSVTVDFSRYYHSSMDIPSLTTDAEPFNMAWA